MLYPLFFVFKGRNRWHKQIDQFINKHTQSVEAKLDHREGNEESLILLSVPRVKHADPDLNSWGGRVSEASIDWSIYDQRVVKNSEHWQIFG